MDRAQSALKDKGRGDEYVAGVTLCVLESGDIIAK